MCPCSSNLRSHGALCHGPSVAYRVPGCVLPYLREERDRELLLERLVKCAEIFRVRIRAYCLMVNHFHGYVQTEEANLWVRGAGSSEAS